MKQIEAAAKQANVLAKWNKWEEVIIVFKNENETKRRLKKKEEVDKT